MHIILIPGLWLDASIWDEVVTHVRGKGHEPVALALPGQGDGTDATLDDQIDAVLAAIDSLAGETALVVVHYSDEARFDVPVTEICPEFPPEDAKAWIENGVPELQKVAHLEYVDIDSGHWPMVSAPLRLAEIIDELTRS
ncbi:alpha/beta fold hydrolase [Luteococcus sp. Sow4_B9]|uniref:alpha/beta fold hydrolase n=1 Tax=Luteococcus sp. Sow4_B9 TaxID=3438792 RepID=UPI003F966EE7